MISIGLFWLVVMLFVLRWIAPRGAERVLPESNRQLEGEMARLRDEVERLAGQVDRLQDEQAFMLRLLESGEPPTRRRELPPPDAAGQTPGH